MNYSWKLGRLCGIDIYLHWSFLIVPAWVALTSLAAGAVWASAVSATLFILAVFGCVLLHELGHALMARHYGVATRDIILLPIGGLARLKGVPRRPRQELAIALAGPAVNLTIGVALLLGLAIAGGVQTLPAANSFLANLALANLALVVFNLLPAFPMDGGRVLRALLALRLPYDRATRIAATVGQGLAVCLAIVGLMGNWSLLLVGLFVFFAARTEAGRVTPRPITPPPADAAETRAPVIVLPAHARADEVAKGLFSEQHYFPVLQGREVVGVLPKAALLRALANRRGDRLIAELMTE